MPRIKPIKLEVGVKIEFVIDHTHKNAILSIEEGIYEGVVTKVGEGLYSNGTICTCDVLYFGEIARCELYPDEILTKFR